MRSRPRGLADLRLDELFGAGDRAASDSRPNLDAESDRRGPASLGGRHADPSGSGGDFDEDEFGDGVDAAPEEDPFASSPQPSDRTRAGSSDASTRSGRKHSWWARGARAARWRIDPERRGAVAVMGAVLLAVMAVGWQALAGRPHAEAVTNSASAAAWNTGSARTLLPSSAGSTGGLASSVPAPSAAAKVVVDVVGRVHRPGLVTLPPGARVADAVRAAGGALARTNLSSINLARVCVDGEQIAIGVPGAVAAPGASASSGAATPGALVNLNTATADQLDALPGVGPVMAQRIIQYRTDHGPFQSIDQLRQVSGIGDAKYADLSPLVTV